MARRRRRCGGCKGRIFVSRRHCRANGHTHYIYIYIYIYIFIYHIYIYVGADPLRVPAASIFVACAPMLHRAVQRAEGLGYFGAPNLLRRATAKLVSEKPWAEWLWSPAPLAAFLVYERWLTPCSRARSQLDEHVLVASGGRNGQIRMQDLPKHSNASRNQSPIENQ